ncbi:MAG: hypothetical protein ACQEUB_14785, partial [Thermodesulfobacteriota bacterium]
MGNLHADPAPPMANLKLCFRNCNLWKKEVVEKWKFKRNPNVDRQAAEGGGQAFRKHHYLMGLKMCGVFAW